MLRFYNCSLFFLVLLCSTFSLFSQQKITYDTIVAEDCSSGRYINILDKSIWVPKNTVFNVGRFIGYAPGMGFCPVFRYANGLKDSLISYCDSFMLILDDERKESSFYLADNGYYYNDKHPFLKVDSIYQLLLSYNHYNDTSIEECVCAPGPGWNLIDYKSPGQSFKLSCLPFKGFCTCDSNMYGTFRDLITGEELRFAQTPFSVEYRSKKQPHWKTLYIHKNTPGSLLIGFSADRSLEQNNYELKFNGECWIIPSRISCMKERNRANPQFFKRL